MLIVALILAVIGLAALVTAVVTSNELIAWVCIGASGLGILLLIADAIRDRARRRAEFPAAVAAAVPAAGAETTEVIEPVVENTEVLEPVEVTDTDIRDETSSGTELLAEDTAEEIAAEEIAAEEIAEEIAADDDIDEDIDDDIDEDIAEDIAEEDHPDELVYEDPDHDLPTDDEADFPEPAEEAAIHTVDSEDLPEADAEDDDAEEYLAEQSDPAADESAVEVRYVASAEDSGPSVVYTYSEGAETEYVDTEEREDRRDQ